MSKLGLRLWNELISLPSDDHTIDAILARQSTASQGQYDVIPIMKKKDPESLRKYILQAENSQLEEDVSEFRQKIMDKWWGPQGRPLPKDKIATLHEPYRHKENHGSLLSMATPSGIRLINAWLSHGKGYVKPLSTPSEAYKRVMRKPQSNSGFRGFTTKDSRTSSVLVPSVRNAVKGEPDPFLVWYRDMRQKFRAIFAGSTSHLILFEAYLAQILRDVQYYLPGIAFCSEKTISELTTAFTRRNTKHTIQSEEGDMEGMDMTVECKLAIEVLTYVMEFYGYPQSDIEQACNTLSMYFRVPLVTLSGDVEYNVEWQLLSGVGPTNGIENYINKFQQLIVLGIMIDVFHVKLVDFMLWVMGDDSALLLAHDDDPQRVHELFIEIFQKVTTHIGLIINPLKQRSSRTSMHFCRRIYPLRPLKGFRMYPGSYIPVPVYPMEYVLNNLIYPEDGRRFDGRDYAGLSYAEWKRTFAILDNAWGDPAWKSFMSALAQVYDPATLVDIARSDAKNPASWRTKVYGVDPWSAHSSPTIAFLINRALK